MTPRNVRPLETLRVVELSHGAGASYAGRLLATLGATVILVEPPGGSPLRTVAPFLPDGKTSALFSYVAVGKQSVVCDLHTEQGRADLNRLIAEADAFITDMAIDERTAHGVAEDQLAAKNPRLTYVSVLPFGAFGPKSGWKGEEINVIHSSGEGFLLPNGLSIDLFPDRPPLKVHGHFAEMQGGIVAAFGALVSLWSRKDVGGQSVDVSSQDATLAVGAFAVQRYGDGSLEHRRTRNFRYGGVLECADGFVEVLPLEEHHWKALIGLLGNPAWAAAPELKDPIERGKNHGGMINRELRAWSKTQKTQELVQRAQDVGVPMAPYNTPAEVMADPQEIFRGLFQPVEIPGVGKVNTLASPFHFDAAPMQLKDGPPRLGQHQDVLRGAAAVTAGAA
jgi:crotonobetainyl-CoA:carnitine CoA-transferase CaiB-like acyl-CoA transferase